MKEPKSTGRTAEFIPPLHVSQDAQSSTARPGAPLCAWLVCADEAASRLVHGCLSALDVACQRLSTLNDLAGTPAPSPALAILVAPAPTRRLHEMCEALRHGPGGTEVLILGLLPDGSPRAQCEALESGCDEVLPWPCDGRLLGLRLALLLRQARERLALHQARHDLHEVRAPLQAVIDAIPAEVFVKDTEGLVMMVNRRTAESWGRPAAEFIGQRSFDARADPKVLDKIAQSDRQVLAVGEPYDGVQIRTMPDGARRPFRVIKAPLRNERGVIVGLVGLAEDISGRMQADERLRRSQALLQAVVDAIPYVVYAKDLESRLIAVNKASEELWQVPASALLNRPFANLPSPTARERETIDRQDQRVLAEGQRVEQLVEVTIPEKGTRHFRSIKVPLVDEEGRVVGLVGMAADITESVLAEEQLRQSQALLQTVFDTIPHDIFVKDRQGRYLMVNRSMARRWGRAPEDFVGTLHPPQLTAEQAAERERTDRQVMEQGELVSGVFQRTHPSGKIRSLHIVKSPLRDGKGDVVGLVGMAEDVTDRIQAERDLRGSRALLQAVFDAIPHAVFVKDREDRYVTVNKATEALQPPEAGSLIGKTLLGEGDRPKGERELSASSTRQVLDGAERVDFNQTVTLGRREPRTFRTVKVPLRDDSGAVTGVVGVAEDITGLVQAERKLRDSRALLQAVFDTIPHDVFVKDRQGRFMMLNRSALQRWDKPLEDFIGQAVSDIGAYPEEIKQIEEADGKLLSNGEPYSGVILRTMRDGSRHPFHVIKRPLRDDAGAIVGLVGLAEDIAERVQAERDLRDSRALLKAVFDAIPHAVYAKNAESRFIAVNRGLEDMLQIPAAKLLTQRFGNDNARTPEDKEMILRQDRRVIECGERVDEVMRIPLPSRGQRDMRIVKVPLHDEEGRIVGLAGLAEDITERVQAEERLRQSQTLLQAVFDTIPQELTVKDRQRKIVMANRRSSERWNQPVEELIGQHSGGERHRTAADLRRAEAADWQVLEEGIPYSAAVQRSLPGGRQRPFQVVKVPLRDAQGTIVGLVALAEDIAERVQAEAALQENRRLLQTILDTLPEAVYVKDRQGRYLLFNKEGARRLECPREQLIGKSLQDLSGFDRETMERLAAADQTVLDTGEITELPQELRSYADGRNMWERRLKAPLRDAGGAIVGIVGIAEDITDRVRAERALKMNELLLRNIIDSLPEALFVKDHARRYRLVNAKLAAAYGMTPEDFVGRPSEEINSQLLRERVEMFAETEQRVLRSGQLVEVPELAFRPYQGGEIWERIVLAPLRDSAGTIAGLLGIKEDITARKKAETERLELERLVQRTQNLESLGAMAGGIAHDFNNLLQRILGYTELAVLEAGPESPAQESLQTVQAAGASAVALTRQMLTLSGGSGFTLEPVDLNGLAQSTEPEMKKLLAPTIALSVRAGADAPVAMADAPLLRQVLLSLVSNASEALAAAPAGEITVAAGIRTLERDKLDDTFSERDLASGVYGYLEVRDTGPGLAESVRRRLYEPFYSTKFIGRGLGLAAVRGIVRGHQGAIQALSAPNEGATFRIYLPAAGGGEARMGAGAPSVPE